MATGPPPPAGVGLPEHGPTPWQILAASMVPGTQQMLQNRWPEERIRERADSDLIQSKLTQINACFFHADATEEPFRTTAEKLLLPILTIKILAF